MKLKTRILSSAIIASYTISAFAKNTDTLRFYPAEYTTSSIVMPDGRKGGNNDGRQAPSFGSGNRPSFNRTTDFVIILSP